MKKHLTASSLTLAILMLVLCTIVVHAENPHLKETTDATIVTCTDDNYIGSVKSDGCITGNLENATVTVADSVITDTNLVPRVTVEYDGITLREGVDYSITYDSPSALGIYNVYVTGNGSNFTGSATANWTVTSLITDDMVSLSQSRINWDDKEHTPSVSVRYDENTTLTEGVDYTVYAHPQIETGDYTLTVTGIGLYSGSVEKDWCIRKYLDSQFNVDVGDVAYTGDPMTPPVIVYGYGNEQLVENTDFEVEYSDNIDIGIATVKITGIGDYYGELNANFQIMDGNAVTLIMDGETVNKANFAEAWSAANGHTATISLLTNQETDGYFNLENGSNITLRTNGFTLSSTGYQPLFQLGNMNNSEYSASLHVTGKGTVATYPGEYDVSGGEAFYVMPGGNLVIDNATVDAGTAIQVYGEGANVTVNSGTIKGYYGNAVRINEGSLTVTGGTFISSEDVIYATDGKVTISGGQFETENACYKVLKFYGEFYGGNIRISGGNFTHKVIGDEDWKTYALYAEYPESITVSGGTFTADIPVYCSKGVNSVLSEGCFFFDAKDGSMLDIDAGATSLSGVTSVRVGMLKDISALCNAELDRDTFTYDGIQHIPDVVVRLKEDKQLLTEKKHYKVEVKGGTEIGSATLYIIGCNGYTGTIECKYSIVPIAIKDCTVIAECEAAYDGKQHSPTVTVYYGNTLLKEDIDYTTEFTPQTNVGTYSVTIEGIGNWSDTIRVTWSIKKSISDAKVSCKTQTYCNDYLKPQLTVTLGEGNDAIVLTQDVDYSVTYQKQINAGTYPISIIGIGKYGGTVTDIDWVIEKYNVQNIKLNVTNVSENEEGCYPIWSVESDFLLQCDTDYVTENRTVEDGLQFALIGKGNFTGETTFNYPDFNKLTNVLKLPEGLETLEEEALAGTNAQVIIIPASVKTIGANAFSGCSNLRLIRFLDDDIEISVDAFGGIDMNQVYIQLPANTGENMEMTTLLQLIIDQRWRTFSPLDKTSNN